MARNKERAMTNKPILVNLSDVTPKRMTEERRLKRQAQRRAMADPNYRRRRGG